MEGSGGAAKSIGDHFRQAWAYAQQEDLLAVRFTSGPPGQADEVFAALQFYGAVPKQAGELDKATKVWADATGKWECCRMFVSRKAAMAIGMLNEFKLELQSGRYVTYWPQQMCGIRGRRIGWIPEMPEVAGWQHKLGEVQGAELTQEIVQHGVQKGVWQSAKDTMLEILW